MIFFLYKHLLLLFYFFIKKKHQELFDFLLNGDLSVIVDDKLDKKMLGQIKFDDKKFEIERSNFIILGK